MRVRRFYRPRLFREMGDSWLAGVCSGLARYFDIDPAFVRIAAVASLLFMTKLTLLCYFIAWVVIPRSRFD